MELYYLKFLFNSPFPTTHSIHSMSQQYLWLSHFCKIIWFFYFRYSYNVYLRIYQFFLEKILKLIRFAFIITECPIHIYEIFNFYFLHFHTCKLKNKIFYNRTCKKDIKNTKFEMWATSEIVCAYSCDRNMRKLNMLCNSFFFFRCNFTDVCC